MTVPTFRRADITREVDLIEEVARLEVLERLPATLPARHGAVGRLTARQQLHRPRAGRARRARPPRDRRLELREPGDGGAAARSEVPAVRLANPMSEEQAQLRTTLTGSLLDAAQRNRSRGAGAVRAVRVRRRLPAARAAARAAADEPHHVAALLMRPGSPRRPGARRIRRRRTSSRSRASSARSWRRSACGWEVRAGAEPFLHPGTGRDDRRRRRGRRLVRGDPSARRRAVGPDRHGRGVRAQPRCGGRAAGRTVCRSDELPGDPRGPGGDRRRHRQRRRGPRVVRAAGKSMLADAEVFDVYRDERAPRRRERLARARAHLPRARTAR